jgi:hypothetical protein
MQFSAASASWTPGMLSERFLFRCGLKSHQVSSL